MSIEQLILTLVQLLFWGGLVFLTILGIWYKKMQTVGLKKEETMSKKPYTQKDVT